MNVLRFRTAALTMAVLLLPLAFLAAGGAGETDAATSPEDLRILDMPNWSHC